MDRQAGRGCVRTIPVSMRDRILTTPSRSQHGSVRAAAFRTLRGPRTLGVAEANGHAIGGWGVLRLRLQFGTVGARAEQRTVYADFTDLAEEAAVLRAVTLDVERLSESGTVLPARFVKMPSVEMRRWMHQFGPIETEVGVCGQASSGEEIRNLRLEPDYLACLFEKAWRPGGKITHLDVAWEHVWADMSSLLETGARLDQVSERFEGIAKATYDLERYRVGALR